MSTDLKCLCGNDGPQQQCPEHGWDVPDNEPRCVQCGASLLGFSDEVIAWGFDSSACEREYNEGGR